MPPPGDGVPSAVRTHLETAERLARRRFPGARNIKARLYVRDVYVEVWDETGASLYALTGQEDE